MSDPHRWDRFDRTRPRPLTPSRVRWILVRRAVIVLAFTGALAVALANALESATRMGWTYFFVALVVWCVVVPVNVMLSVVLVKTRKG